MVNVKIHVKLILQSPYSGVNSRGKKLSHGNAFGMFGIAQPPKPKGEHHGSGHT